MGLARTFDHLARHTYTRTPVADTPGDDTTYYESAETPGVPVVGVRCRFVRAGEVGFTQLGAALAEADTLHVFPSDPLAVGDLVSDVRDRDGRVLLAGPLRVADIADMAGIGATFKRVASLRGAAEVG